MRLDSKLNDQETAPLDQSFYNELVEKLDQLRQSKDVQLQTSASVAEVHPDESAGHPLQPSTVIVSDITGWGHPDIGVLEVNWSIVNGPGHLEHAGRGPASEITTRPDAAVQWAWGRGSSDSYYDQRPGRDWNAQIDGDPLPAEVQVRAEVRALALETSGPSVSDEQALTSLDVADGHRRLVRVQDAIYKYHSSVFDDEVPSVSGLASASGASDGDTYVLADGRYYDLDTSISTASGDDVAHDPDGDSTNEGVWVYQGQADVIVDTTGDGSADSHWTSEQSVTSENYVTVSTEHTHFIVERGYDPDYSAAIQPTIDLGRDVAYLSPDGTVDIEVIDRTEVANRVGVFRTVSAHMKGGGESVSVSGDYLDGSTAIESTTEEDRTFTVTPQSAGLLVVEAEYEHDGQIRTTRQALRVRPAFDLDVDGGTPPTLPNVDVRPLDGAFELEVGTEVTGLNVTRTGEVFSEPSGDPGNAQVQSLVGGVAFEQLSGPTGDGGGGGTPNTVGGVPRNGSDLAANTSDGQLEMLRRAGGMMFSALHQPTDNGLNRYTVDLPAGVANAGDMVWFGLGSKIRLTGVAEDQPSDGKRFRGVGVLEDGADLSEARVTGNGSFYDIEIELYYGQPGVLPAADAHMTRKVRLTPGDPTTSITLPSRTPSQPGDQWMARTRVSSGWTDGREVVGSYSQWMEAEALPESNMSASLTTSETSGLQLEIDAESEIVGALGWRPPAVRDPDLGELSRMPKSLPASPDPRLWEDPTRPPHLHLEALETAQAGSTKQQTAQFDIPLPQEARRALPKTELPDNQVPNEWPVVDGMLLSGEGTNWIGIGDEYVQFGQSNAQLVSDVYVRVDEGPDVRTSRRSPARFEKALTVLEVNQVEVRLETSPAVDRVEQLNGAPTMVTTVSGVEPVEGGYRQLMTLPQSYEPHEELRYLVAAGETERIVTVDLKNASVADQTKPQIRRIEPLVLTTSESSITKTEDLSTNPPTYTLTMPTNSSASWASSAVTIVVSDLGYAEIQSATDLSDNSAIDISDGFRFSAEQEPGNIILTTEHDAFATAGGVEMVVAMYPNENPDTEPSLASIQFYNS